jgi:CheY-like chemotaxis protein
METTNLQRDSRITRIQNTSTHRATPPRILVVDDDPILRDVYAMVLEVEEYELEVAGDGQEALERLSNARFDLVITDRDMPRMDGAELIRHLMADGMDVPVVMISGSLRDSKLPPDIAPRVAVALPKPVTAAQILAAAAFALQPDPFVPKKPVPAWQHEIFDAA